MIWLLAPLVFVLLWLVHLTPALISFRLMGHTNKRTRIHLLWITCVIALFLVALRLAERLPLSSQIAHYFLLAEQFSNLWLGVVFYTFLFSVPFYVILLLWGKIDRFGVWSLVLLVWLVGGLMVYGTWQFSRIHTVYIDETSPKLSHNYQFIVLSDTQLGSLNRIDGLRIQQKIQRLLRTEHVDGILFTGDAVDTGLYSNDLLETLHFDDTTPVYFVNGNHEKYHDTFPQRPLQKALQKLHYRILDNKATWVSRELRIVGFQDKAFGQTVQQTLKKNPHLLKPNHQVYQLILTHRPDKEAIDTLAKNGADWILAGHTHAGQIEPIHTLLKLFQTYSYGLYNLSQGHLYVTSGVGVWGPKLRIGTQNEVVLLRLYPLQD